MRMSCQQEQDRRIAQREQAIREIAGVYRLKGYDQTPLERDKVLEFLARLSELQRKQQVEYENLQVRKYLDIFLESRCDLATIIE